MTQTWVTTTDVLSCCAMIKFKSSPTGLQQGTSTVLHLFSKDSSSPVKSLPQSSMDPDGWNCGTWWEPPSASSKVTVRSSGSCGTGVPVFHSFLPVMSWSGGMTLMKKRFSQRIDRFTFGYFLELQKVKNIGIFHILILLIYTYLQLLCFWNLIMGLLSNVLKKV